MVSHLEPGRRLTHVHWSPCFDCWVFHLVLGALWGSICWETSHMVSSDEGNVPVAMNIVGSCVCGGARGPLGSGAGGPLDSLESGGARGIWRTGAGGSWKRVRLNRKSPLRESVCQYVCEGRVRHGPMSQNGKGQPTPSKQTAKKCRDELQGLRADKRFRDIDLEHWTAKRSAGRRRPSEQFLPTWCWLSGRVYHGSAPLRVSVVGRFHLFAQYSCVHWT